jgi:hypothetical protein
MAKRKIIFQKKNFNQPISNLEMLINQNTKDNTAILFLEKSNFVKVVLRKIKQESR